MNQILSKTPPSFDISAAFFRDGARDVGEAIAVLVGGHRPDPEDVARVSASLRTLQGFLILEAEAQQYRDAVAASGLIATSVQRDPGVSLSPIMGAW